MIKYQDLLSKSKALSLIKRDIAENMLSHAYMIVSEDNGALEEFYKLVLLAIYCGKNPDENSPQAVKILNRNHSDVIHVEKEKSIVVDDIKEIIENCYVSSVEGGKKVIVIHKANAMTIGAQNKLLKILEEPPKDIVFILGVNNINSILQTVQSRVKKIALDVFSSDEIYEELKKYSQGIDDEKVKIASACCDGKISRAQELLDDDRYLSLYNKTVQLLITLRKSSQIASFIGDDMFSRENLPDVLDILMLILRDVAIVKKDKNLVISKHILSSIEALSNDFSLASAIGIIEHIEKFKKMLYYNINSTNVAEQLLFAILEVKYKCN